MIACGWLAASAAAVATDSGILIQIGARVKVCQTHIARILFTHASLCCFCCLLSSGVHCRHIIIPHHSIVVIVREWCDTTRLHSGWCKHRVVSAAIIIMPNQCRNCGRDVNNNYAPYQNAYAAQASSSSTSGGGASGSSGIGGGGNSNGNSNGHGHGNNGSNNNGMGGGGGHNGEKKMNVGGQQMTPQITAKVMFGTVGAIKELREKEQAEKNGSLGGGGGRRY